MKVEVEDIRPSRKRIHIEAAWDEVKNDYADVLKQFVRLDVPGFRPGRAPRGVIEQRYAKDIAEEVTDRCARRLWRAHLDEHDLGMVGIAEIYDMEFARGESFAFKAECDVVPEFTLPVCVGMSLSKDAAEDTLRDEISRYLLDNTRLALPPSFVDGEMEGEGVAENDPGYEDIRKAAEARVKLMIILKRIAREDGLEVDDRDVDERIAAIAEAEGTTPNLLRNELATKGGMTRLRDLLLAERVLDYIIENAR